MQLFLDTTDTAVLKDLAATGLVDGVTTNPTLIAKSGRPMLQFMVTGEAVTRAHRYADQARDVQFNPVGQVVGQMKKIRKTSDVILDLVEGYVDATSRLEALNKG